MPKLRQAFDEAKEVPLVLNILQVIAIVLTIISLIWAFFGLTRTLQQRTLIRLTFVGIITLVTVQISILILQLLQLH